MNGILETYRNFLQELLEDRAVIESSPIHDGLEELDELIEKYKRIVSEWETLVEQMNNQVLAIKAEDGMITQAIEEMRRLTNG